MLYKKMVPTTSSTGASVGDLSPQLSSLTRDGLTNKRKQVPREIANTIDVRGHEGHNLSL